ncbi:hypothetical protein N7491_002674 [Penicillium cf. griseofulvum]|uniref:Zn(2)-C6 fungal-type domain-containing protein n=1 Tax=Penicillium cf. griseofulvum TaxID=2972120 RepID=A0A9W9MSK4_9EURO|nr:hypothetical protein N7472_003158 [Penicillium cf. griseofulvum]KAJ5440268.1 hypothetical protein N7491_002674 [Penicillium cf. griseofulvum]KAJ5448317.1 hypothetical protein N7445_003138 [Penicillium cf. griseofulvum]
MDRNRIQTLRASKTSPHITSLQTPKLKDSCDKCSTSKVRCTKEKPFCARCEKLGYTCFYSPARRAGRPYRVRKQISEGTNSEEPNQAPARDITTAQFVDESAILYSRFNAPAPVDVTSNSSISNSTLQANSTRLNNGTEQPELNKPKSHHASDPDCMLVALDILSEIEVPAEQLRRVSLIDARLLSTTTQTITAAFHRLSIILICPCSELAEVGMVVSAICMSIIDIHAMTIANIAKGQPPTGMLSQPISWDSPSVESHRSPAHEATAMQVFAELSELAKLILQLTDRYNEGSEGLNRVGLGNASELPTDFLPGMGTFLQERLQQITNDATQWL